MPKKTDYDTIKNQFKERGYLLLSTEYKSLKDKLQYLCPIHSDMGMQEITYNAFSCGKGCRYCGYERTRKAKFIDENTLRDGMDDRGYIYIGRIVNDQLRAGILYVCPKHRNQGVMYIEMSNFKQGHGCPSCGYEKYSGKNHYKWQGGISTLRLYLADKINDWKVESLKEGKYKCAVSGATANLEVHHTYPYHFIINDTLDELGLDIRDNISEYSEEELKNIIDKFKEIHYRHPLGVVLHHDIHRLYHKMYGNNAGYQEYIKFVELYKTGVLESVAAVVA
jgi:hypothetical protein